MNSLRPCPHKSGNFEDAYVLLPTLGMDRMFETILESGFKRCGFGEWIH